jgi:hypothetical protein
MAASGVKAARLAGRKRDARFVTWPRPDLIEAVAREA